MEPDRTAGSLWGSIRKKYQKENDVNLSPLVPGASTFVVAKSKNKALNISIYALTEDDYWQLEEKKVKNEIIKICTYFFKVIL